MILSLDETGSCWEPLKPSRGGVHIFTSGSCVLLLSSRGNRCRVGFRAKAKPKMEASHSHFSLGSNLDQPQDKLVELRVGCLGGR